MNAFHPAMFAGSAFWQPAGEAMLEFLVSGSAVALFFMLVRRAIGRLPAAIRYVAASTAMAALVGLAGYHAWAQWPVSPSPGAAVTGGASPMALPEPSAVGPSAASAAVISPPAPSLAQATGRFTWETIKPRMILALPALWLIGAPLTALFVGLGWTGATRLRRQSSPLLDEALLARFARCQSLMREKNVGLAVCERISAPIVVGVLRPMILLPPALLTSLTCDQWEMILLHELAHVRRLDNLVNLLQRAVETVLFFHPAVWWASRWMRLEREHCCDAVVLRLGSSPQSYAETLAVLALPGIAPQLATAATANHELLTRMRHILGTEDLPMTISWKKLGLAALVIAAVGGAFATGRSGWSQSAAAEEDRSSIRDVAGVEWLLRNRDFTFDADFGAQFQKEAEELVRFRNLLLSEDTRESQELVALCNQLLQRLKVLEEKRAAEDRQRLEKRKSPQPDRGANWSPNQMLGPPDVKEHGDNPNAWAARNPDQGEEWVRLGYERPIKAAAILIYESFNPGAVTSVRILGDGISGEEIVWKASGGPNPIQTKNVLAIPIQDPSRTRISAVNIHLDERRTPGWNEIDAVGLFDAETGETHWARTAEASSTYAAVYDGPGVMLTTPPESPSPKGAWSAEQVLGPPDVSDHGDDPNAWAAREPDQGEEWLEVDFGEARLAAAVVIHESFNPGAIDRVEFIGLRDRSVIKAVYQTPAMKSGKHVCVVRPEGFTMIRAVRIYVDERRVPGWNEIDAVGLIGARSGEMHWATRATASSSFAEHGAGVGAVHMPPAVREAAGWSPAQATGAPNVEKQGDDERAWASATADGQDEWLELVYDPPVPVRTIAVFQSFNPGAIRKITVSGPKRLGGDLTKGVPATDVWDAKASEQSESRRECFVVQVPDDLGHLVSKVRLEIDSKGVPGWNEIDAVGLHDRETGRMHWARDAKASSWFGEHGTSGGISQGGGGVAFAPALIPDPEVLDVPIVSPVGVSAGWATSSAGWHPSQATGAPNVKEAGDNPQAWASATPDGQQEWLELTYDPPVLASSMSIYESYNPGAISEVLIEEVDPIADALPPGKDGFRTLMKGGQLYRQGRNGLGITLVTVKTNIRPIRRVRLTIDSPSVPGWNEIDAVGLLSTTGEMHWAKEAKASSWYGESEPMGVGPRSSLERAGHADKIVFGGVEVRDVADLVIAPQVLNQEGEAYREAGAPGLQVAASQTASVDLLTESRNVDIDAAGVITLGGRTLTGDELAKVLRARVEKDPQASVRIRAHQECSFQDVKQLFDVCKQAGVVKLALTRGESDPGAARSSSVDLDRLAVVPFDDDIVVNLNDAQPHFLRFKLRLLADKEGQAGLEAVLERYRVVLKDRLLQHCGDKSTTELRGGAGIQLLKDGILSTIRDALPAEPRESVKDVLLEEVIIQ